MHEGPLEQDELLLVMLMECHRVRLLVIELMRTAVGVNVEEVDPWVVLLEEKFV